MVRTIRVFAVWAAVVMAVGATSPAPRAEEAVKVPRFTADPWWPKPLPQEKDSQGQLRRWLPGQVGGVCVDSHDHIFTFNRLWPKLGTYESMSGMYSPEVIVFDYAGNVINSWGNKTKGSPAVLPYAHGCTVDNEDNVWLVGTSVAQKWSHDGKKLLLQIGEAGVCDGDASRNPKPNEPNLTGVVPPPTCGEAVSLNSSKTLLNYPAGIRVDRDRDPVTGQRGNIYIADGYGNHRVVVFDSKGKFVRQYGSAGDGPGQFSKTGGGHPHCVAVSKDGLVYACDRTLSKIEVFDKLGNYKQTIPINPENGTVARQRTADLALSRDPAQTYLFNSDLGNNVVRILERKTGRLVGTIGVGPGRGTGEIITPHLLDTDSKGNLYVSSTADSNRVQRFLLER